MLTLNNVNYGDKIAVAVSGGVDSVVLLHALNERKTALNLTLYAVNIDHSIRGKDSENDSLFVKNYCEKLGVSLYFEKVDAVEFSKTNKLSLENGARVLRYEVFNKFLRTNSGFKIATAHHKNDLFESVLFNIFRGTGIKGLKGIESEAYGIIRPMLSNTREEIEEYAKQNNLSYVVDKTNFDNDYSRNFIRNELTPLILSKFPTALNSVYSLSEVARNEDDFIENYAEKLLILKNGNYAVSVNEHPAVIKRAIILAFKNCGIIKDYEKAHVDGVYNLLFLNAGSEFTLPKGVTAVKGYGEIIFYTNYNAKSSEFIPYAEGIFSFGGYKILVNQIQSISNLEKPSTAIYFDGDKIPPTAVIRFRTGGDVFTKFGGGTKKLKDYLIDKKIPVRERDHLPVIAVENDILAILGVEISEKVKISNDTKRIIKCEIIKE